MRKMALTELLKNTAAFVGVSALAVDATLLLADRVGVVRDVPGDWYITAPLGVWCAVGIPVSINLAGRIIAQSKAKQDAHITVGLEGDGSPALRRIPFWHSGRQDTVLASVAPNIFHNQVPEEEGVTYRPAVWRVTNDDGITTVIREAELREFLNACYRRSKHQFSRRYWCEQRRPPMYRGKYDAIMALLNRAGLVEGRYDHGRASGRLVVFPREALTFLKYTSPFRAV